MQRLSMLLPALCIAVSMKAQVKEGTIIYERRVNMHKNIPKEDERIKNILPEFSITKVKLHFAGDESLSSNMEAEPDLIESAGEEGNNRIRIRLNQPETETYKNYLNRTTKSGESNLSTSAA